METETRQLIDKKIAQIEKAGHGEIILKFKNGIVWRLLTTEDILVLNTKEKG